MLEGTSRSRKVPKMKNANYSCLLCAVICALCVSVAAEEEDPRGPYTTKYDNIDIESVIKNQRLLNNYVGCLLDRNPCTPDAIELKTNLPDALATNCSGCSERQRQMSDRLSHHLIDHRPDDWSLLEQKYDPTGAYREQYLQGKEESEDPEPGDADPPADGPREPGEPASEPEESA